MHGGLQGMRIVVVDDDADARDLLCTILNQREAVTYEADCAAAAYDLVVEQRPDVLVSDVAMPEEDGYMLIGRVRALSAEEGGRTHAIAVTAYAGRADHQRAIDAGFDAHFSKPVDIDKLVGHFIDFRAARDLAKGGG